MIVTLAMTKGGVSKSTLSTNLAEYFTREGIATRVIDLDHKNKGSYSFFQKRAKNGYIATECILVDNYDELIDAICFNGVVIIDTGAFDDDITRAVISASDMLVVPFNPKSDKDAEGFLNFLDTISEIEAVRETAVPTYLVASMIHPLRKPQQILRDIEPILGDNILMGGIMTRRASYEHSGFNGECVFDTYDNKAMLEIKTIGDNIIKGMNE